MTTASISTSASVATAADVQGWATAIHNAMVAVGIVQTSDTGQTAPGSLAAPTVAPAAIGYCVYRFNDAAQATQPIFFKLEYGAQGNSTTPTLGFPCLWLTVGKGSDGAGNITNVLLPRVQLGMTTANPSGTGSASLFTGRVSGGTGWLSVFPWNGVNASASGMGSAAYKMSYFHIERVSSDAGLVICHMPSGSSSAVSHLSGGLVSSMPWVYTFNYASGVANLGSAPVSIPYSVGGSALGAATSLAAGAVGPAFPWTNIPPALAPTQPVGIVTIPGGDMPTGPFTMTLGGVSRTYMPIPICDAYNGFALAAQVNTTGTTVNSRWTGCAIRWD
jgi:hypothetical protein